MIKYIDKTIDYFSKYIPIIKKFRKISKYLFFSIMATIADIIVLYLLTNFVGIYYLISASISYIIGMIIAFFGNLKYTFKRNHNKKVYNQFISFTIISLIGLVLNLVLMKLFTDYIGIWYIYSKIIAVLIIFFIKYFAHKKFVFE
jgi:putative flippase GtrA